MRSSTHGVAFASGARRKFCTVFAGPSRRWLCRGSSEHSRYSSSPTSRQRRALLAEYGTQLPPGTTRLIGWLIPVWTVFLPATALAGGGGDGGHKVIANIAISLVAASALSFAMKMLKQPLLLGYILAGVVIGPIGLGIITDHTEIVTIAEIGLILLLFMIGLEIDVKAMLKAGRRVIVPGILQFPLSVGIGYLVFGLLENVGIFLGAGAYARIYVSIAIGIGSTMIVVKLLADKMELDTLPGRITIGILVFQDIWAIIVLAIQPNLNNPEIGGLAKTFGVGALLVGAAVALAQFVLPALFRRAAKLPELVLVMALGWCFLVALVAANPTVGLSMEMGALIAGVSLAAFPYNLDIVAKTTNIRDFFITLFFVALGMQIPMPTPEVLGVAAAIIAVVLLLRAIGVFTVLYVIKSGLRASNLATVNLCQVSEFGLVILSLGIGFGHIEADTLTYLIWVFAILAVLSTYGITYSHPIQTALSKAQRKIGIKDIGDGDAETPGATQHRVVMLGFFRIASAFLAAVRERNPELLKDILVIDFNPVVKGKLDEMGVDCIYGDVGNRDTLHHANVHEADVILCTIPDAVLKGTDNKKILGLLQGVAPHSKIVVTARNATHAKELYGAGAGFVLEPSRAAGASLVDIVEMSLAGDHEARRNEIVERLTQEPEEVLA